MSGYSAELLDRVADSMSRAQTYGTRVGLGPPERRYEVVFTPPASEKDPEPEDIVVVGLPTREQAIDAREIMEARARAAAALLAVGYIEP